MIRENDLFAGGLVILLAVLMAGFGMTYSGHHIINTILMYFVLITTLSLARLEMERDNERDNDSAVFYSFLVLLTIMDLLILVITNRAPFMWGIIYTAIVIISAIAMYSVYCSSINKEKSR